MSPVTASGEFLDTSALAKLYHVETGSERMEALVRSPGVHLVLSELTLIEIQSVFARKVRTGVLDPAALDQLRGLFFADLAKRRFDVVRLARRHLREAEKLIRTYAAGRALRTLDSLQLAVALDLHRRGIASTFVAADKNLCSVAASEGLQVLNPQFDV